MRFPDLYFFEVPTQVDEKRKWLTIAKREEHINNRMARWYCCEEHFETEDIRNYEQFKQKKSIPILKDGVIPHILPTISAPSLPVPKRANLEEWDKFKRRLIRAVYRLLIKESKPEEEVWAFLKKETGCDCLLLWDRMRSLSLKKMSRLLLADDKTALIPTVARMTVTDWLMCDLIIVHEDIDVIGRTDELAKPMTRDYPALIELFSVVQRFNVENLEGESLALAWSAAVKHYNIGGRHCTPMLLQRRWYQLKEWTRIHFYEFWHTYRGNKSRFDKNKQNMPGKLQRAVARRFPNVITNNFSTWEDLINWEKVILPEHFEALVHRELPTPRKDDDPDLVILEQHIETITVDSDDDSNSKENPTDETATNFNIASEMEGCGYDPNKVKDEPITEIDVDEHEFDKNALLLDSTRKALEEVDRAFAAQEANLELNDETVSKDLDVDVLNNEEDNVEEENIDCFDDVTQSSFDIQMPKITNVFGNIANEDLSNLSAKKSTIQDEDIANIDDDIDENIIDDIIQYNLNDLSDVSNPKADVATVNSEECLEKSKVKFDNVQTLTQEEHVTDVILDESSEEISFMDEGITFLDDGIEEDDDIVDNVDLTKNELVKLKNEVKEIEHDENEDTPKFDLKLLMEPVVYTTRLDQMQNFSNKNFTRVKVESILDSIVKESKPVSKRSLSYLQNDKKNNGKVLDKQIENEDSDDSNHLIKREPGEEDLIEKNPEEIKVRKIEIEVDTDISHIQRVKLTSHLLQKPKNRDYTPIQICKNPDFNTRLKRLNMGFYNHERNIQYLNMCKPLTIDLHKSFESKLIGNTLYLRPSEVIDYAPQKDKDVLDQTVNINIIPFAGPVQSLMNVPEPTAQELSVVSSSGTLSPSRPMSANELTPSCKRISDDVEQLTRLQSPMPQPCLLARQLSPPHQQNKPILPTHENTKNPSFSGPPPKLHNYTHKLFKIKDQRITINRPKTTIPQPSWLSKRIKQSAVKLDEFLIQPDTLGKMLLLMNSTDEHSMNEKVVVFSPQVPVLETVGAKSKMNESPNNILSDEKKMATPLQPVDVEEVSANSNIDGETKSNQTQTNDNEVIDVDKPSNEAPKPKAKAKKNKKPKVQYVPRKYCCWARKKILNVGKKNYIKHKCPLDKCECCCMDEFQKFMAAYRSKMTNYKVQLQIEMEKHKAQHEGTGPMSVPMPEPVSVPIVQSATNMPVAHIRIVPQQTIKERPIIPAIEKNKATVKNLFTTRPSLVIDGTSTSMLIAKGATKSPIYVGKNKVLLTTMALPPYLDDVVYQEKTPNAKIVSSMEIPMGVQLVLLPNGRVTFTVEENTILTEEQRDRIPKILSAVQKQLEKNVSQSLNKKAINTSDEIVISDDEVPNDKSFDEQNMAVDSILPNESMKNNNPKSDDIEISENQDVNPILNRNTLLSDLMQMSGISFDDTVSQNQPSVAQTIITDQAIRENASTMPQSLDSSLSVDGSEAVIPTDGAIPASAVLPDIIVSNIIGSNIHKNQDPSTEVVTTTAPSNNKEKVLEATNTVDSALLISTNDKVPIIPISSEDTVLEAPSNSVEVSVPTPVISSPTDAAGAEINESSNNIAPIVPVAVENNILEELSTSIITRASTDNVSANISEVAEIVPEIPISVDASSLLRPDAYIAADGKDKTVTPPTLTPCKVSTRNPNIIHPNLSDFTVVTSFAKLKYVVENNGKFFKLDLDTGIVSPINVSVKKKAGLSNRSPSKKPFRLETEEIDLTEEEPSKPNDAVLTPFHGNKPQYLRLASPQKLFQKPEPPRPVKLIRAVPPNILRKRMLSTTLLKQDNAFVVKQKRKQRLMARIVAASTPCRPMEIEILDSDEDDKIPAQKAPPNPSNDDGSDSETSDDEPLSKISKRIHNPQDKSDVEITLNTSDKTDTKAKSIGNLSPNTYAIKPQEQDPLLKLNEEAISTVTPMEVDLAEPSPSIDLQTEPSAKSLILPEQCFIQCSIPKYNDDDENSSDGSDDCILGV